MAQDDYSSKTAMDAFTVICQFCKEYNGRPALTTNSTEVKSVATALYALKTWAEQLFNEYKVEISRGSGHFPRVPWLAILPPKQKVSDGVYFVICFGREGAGAVAGCATSVTNSTGLPAIKRSGKGILAINVNGDRLTTLYNDAFANPLEIRPSTFDEEELKNHVRQSLELCKKHIAGAPKPLYDAPKSTKELPAEILREFPNLVKSEEGEYNTHRFDIESLDDRRRRINRILVVREGQPEFRQRVMRAYDERCAITDCNVPDALEAAHIIRYAGRVSHHASNGILLRADIHALFDRGLLTIDSTTMTVILHPKLQKSVYGGPDLPPLYVPTGC